MQCSHCGSTNVHRSKRANKMEVLRSWTGVYPYRCYVCNARFYAVRESWRKSTPEAFSDAPPAAGQAEAEAPAEAEKPSRRHRRRDQGNQAKYIAWYAVGVVLVIVLIVVLTRLHS